MQNNEDSCAERQSSIENHGSIQANESMTTARQSLHEDGSPLTASPVS